ncbi:MAG: hypothetical protein ACRYG7_26490 [Janthinobacterium lividum]
MVTPNPAPTGEDTQPSTAGPITNLDADRDQNASGNPETVTQEDLASSDGSGIRGDYGDAEQTNGLEGGENALTDTSPDRADQNSAESNEV